MGGSPLHTIASILELLKMLSEVKVASKCGPSVQIEKQTMP